MVGGSCLHDVEQVDVQGMTAAELGLLGEFAVELVSNAVEELDVALVGVLLQAADEGP